MRSRVATRRSQRPCRSWPTAWIPATCPGPISLSTITHVSAPIPITVEELASGAARLDLGVTGRPTVTLLTVDLDSCTALPDDVLERAIAVLALPHTPAIGTTERPLSQTATRLAQALDLTLTNHNQDGSSDPWVIQVDDPIATLDKLAANMAPRPVTSAVLCQTLRVTSRLPVPDGLVVESMAYSMLLASSEFRGWRNARPRRSPPTPLDPVRLERADDTLTIVLDHPARRNAYSRAIRDGLVEGLELAAWDPSIEMIHLRGEGPTFCSGGDLDEFGTIDDVSAAHFIRLRQGAGAAVHFIRDRVTAHLHGQCIGAGIEIPAFAGRVMARPHTTCRLPELAMGLIPGPAVSRRLAEVEARWLDRGFPADRDRVLAIAREVLGLV